MDNELKQHLTASETWIRGLYILLFIFIMVVARVVTGAVVVILFLFTVFSGQTNEKLRTFGASLANFVYQVLLFVTYNTDNKPFPFGEWPGAEASVKTVVETVKAEPAKPKAKPKTKSKPKAKSKPKPKSKPKTKPEAKPEAEPEIKPEAESATDTGAAEGSVDTRPEN